ncbi:MAG: type III-A CRISPR-associated protein Cas10/Csm1 [Candidatus Bipolaricaulota bacterium]|nr:type III-A CRISPR-associated protein Cas10/Csm1 [Candidatus Bipolaricaulota bacterium]
MKEELGKIALAGLLHDIGKLGARAGETTAEGKDHAAVGEKFVRQYVPRPWQDALAPVGWHHHDPERVGQALFPVQVVMAADRLSAGERERRAGKEDEPLAQMVSPFARLAPLPHARTWLPLLPLELRPQHLFALARPWEEARVRQAYADLWRDFCAGAEALRRLHEAEPHLESYLIGLLDLLLRYTWAVPSAFYYDVPDVSLYDHLRTTAALAVCVYAAFSQRQAELAGLLAQLRGRDPQEWPEEPAVAGLVEGDLSGIQDFLYGLRHPKGAAAILRARSFYLQVLTEAVARWILRELGLPPTNLLYCGGGRFRLLVPPAELARVEEFRVQANRILLKAHHGGLYLALAGVPLAPAHFGAAPVKRENGGWRSPRGLRAAEDGLNRALARQKDRRFLELPSEELEELFAPYAEGKEVCRVCGAPADAGEMEQDPEEPELRWCPRCERFRELGRNLRNAKYLRFTWGPVRALPEKPTWEEVLAGFGVQLEVGRDPPPPGRAPALLYGLDAPPPSPRQAHEAVARKFLVNVVPLWRPGEAPPSPEKAYAANPGEIKHFGVLARQARGAPYLGVLRMDMDNLGWLFRDGFLAQEDSGAYVDRGTFSRKHSLSTLLTVFFEGYVGELVRNLAQGEGVERVYAVYSGGDDLFLVGSWDAVLTLAQQVREDFAGFTGRRDLGISAGFLLVHEKYPLYLAAQEAGARLEEAKATGVRSSDLTPPQKDRIGFLGRVVPWAAFAEVREWKERLVRAVEADEAARRVLFVVREMEALYQEGRKRRGPWGPWIWRTAYWLARQRLAAAREKRPLELYQDLQQRLRWEAFAQNIETLSLAARWAELETRGGER